jgi:hypothetical protein
MAVNEIKFPVIVKWSQNKQQAIQDFFSTAEVSQVGGCIDGMLMNIATCHVYEEQFVDSHGDHSINCMAVCGPDIRFYYSTANWHGSVHDANVLRRDLCQIVEEGWWPFSHSVLLGDSTYPLKEWLITLKRNYLHEARAQRSTGAHKNTRRFVGNSVGIFKEKFPCLNHLCI